MSGPEDTTASRSAKLASALNATTAAATAAAAAIAALTTAASGQPPPPGKIYKFYFEIKLMILQCNHGILTKVYMIRKCLKLYHLLCRR